VSIEEVRTLVAERQRYDEWLAALEVKRAETPARVFERVYGDYVGRRAAVLMQLQAHVGALATSRGELEQRLGALDGQLASLEEELAEGMLRNLVGEYDHERWDAVRQDIEGRIATLGAARGALLTEVEDVRALLASAHVEPAVADDSAAVAPAAATPAAVVAAIATPAVVPVVESHAESDPTTELPAQVNTSTPTSVVTLTLEPTPLVVPALSLTPTAVPVGATAVSGAHAAQVADAAGGALLDIDVSGMVENPVPAAARHEDVLADVAALFNTSSIAAVPEPEAPAASATPTPALSAEAVAQQAEVDHALAMFGESTGTADAQFVQSLQGIEPEHDTRMERSTATVTPRPAPGAADPFDDLAFLRSVIDPNGAAEPSPPNAFGTGTAGAGGANGSANTTEPQKTLRCTECGTMNLPTEWYCERCGGELAAF
jgi:hypothetical protein